MSGEFRYKAFISYSHADKRAAERLFNRLESYRLPRRLLAEDPQGGARGGGLGVFFRDREELPASGDLGREVRQALAQSEFLIVLCSPEAARSQWVDKEIAEFKAIHGEGEVLAAVIDGEPNADGKVGASECFPKSLRFAPTQAGADAPARAEPLAADFRPGRDGERLGFLKLVSALAGIELARLLDRDQERTQRRVTAVTLVSLGIVLIMGALTLVAAEARREAERQRETALLAQGEAEARRNDAEGLIEFMLTDLREKLEPVGRLDALQVVADRAEAYYDAQDVETMADDALARRARVFRHIGEIDNRRGDLASALRRWTDSAVATEALLARAPDDAERIFEHAQSAYWIGYADYRSIDREAAIAHWRLYRDLAERLIAAEPQSSRGYRELAAANLNLGTLHFLLPGASAVDPGPYFREALQGYEAAQRHDGPDRDLSLNIATALAWLADAVVTNGPLEEARAHRRSQLAIYESLLADDPGDFRLRLNRIRNVIALGQIETFLGRPEAALAALKPALAEAERLLALEPDDDRVKHDIATLSVRIAESALKAGDIALAEATIEALRRRIGARRGENDSADWAIRHAQLDLAEIELALRKGARARADALTSAALDSLEPRLNSERASLHVKAAYARALAHRATLAEASGRRDLAREAHEKIVALLAAHERQLNPATRLVIARARVALGDLDEAARIVATADAQGFAGAEIGQILVMNAALSGDSENAEP